MLFRSSCPAPTHSSRPAPTNPDRIRAGLLLATVRLDCTWSRRWTKSTILSSCVPPVKAAFCRAQLISLLQLLRLLDPTSEHCTVPHHYTAPTTLSLHFRPRSSPSFTDLSLHSHFQPTRTRTHPSARLDRFWIGYIDTAAPGVQVSRTRR